VRVEPRIIARRYSYGSDMVMPKLRHVLAQCPRRLTMNDPCMIIFAERVER
jgi:hypothetical protein